MARVPIPTEGAVTPAEALRFKTVADEVLLSPRFRMGKHTSHSTWSIFCVYRKNHPAYSN